MNEGALLEELLRHRLDMIVQRLDQVEVALHGNELILNMCVAYARQAVAKCVAVETRLQTLEESSLVIQQKQIAELRAELDTAMGRIENMAQWAKTKGKE